MRLRSCSIPGLLILVVTLCRAAGTFAAEGVEPPKTLFQWPAQDASPGNDDEEQEEEDTIQTDRPDFTEASSTVGRGVLQIESGYTFSSDNDGPARATSHSAPEALFRLGVLADWLELRAAQNFASEDDGFTQTGGGEDLYLGAKLALTLQQGAFPEMALMPQMTVPTGRRGLSSEEVLPGVNWLYGWDVNEFLSTGGSTQVNRAIDETGDDYAEFAQSWTIGYSLTKQLGAYTEWFAIIPHNADTARTQQYFDGGFTYKFTPNIQWDIRGGVGLNQAADDFFVGTGLSVRFK